MMLFLTVALVHFIALVSPGPDFFLISQLAASRSRRVARVASLGTTCGVAIWAAVALMGLHLLLTKMVWLHQIIMAGSGIYLLWMGSQLLRSACQRHKRPKQPEAKMDTPDRGRNFLNGLLTSLSNPKAVIYFGSVFSLVIDDSVGVAERWQLFLLIVSETFCWFSLVATIFALPAIRQGYQRVAKWIDATAGFLFAAFGLHLIISR